MKLVFDNPLNLLFLLSLPLLIIFHYIMLKYVRGRVLQFANFVAMSRITQVQIQPKNTLQLIIRLATLSFIVFAVAGTHLEYLSQGASADYVLALDVSSSMSSTDISPTRFAAAKQAALTFVDSTPELAPVGVVSFSGSAFIEHELSNDKESVKNAITNLELSLVGGTDIGEAIISSSTLLLNSDSAKTIILLTDGGSNIGVGSLRALQYANDNTVQIFTIGVGTQEGGSPDGLNVSLKLDQGFLEQIASSTDGEYISAQSSEEISAAYNRIIQSTERKQDIDLTVTLLFLVLLGSFIDWMLLNTRYRRIP